MPNQEGMDSNGNLADVWVYIGEIPALVTTTEAYSHSKSLAIATQGMENGSLGTVQRGVNSF